MIDFYEVFWSIYLVFCVVIIPIVTAARMEHDRIWWWLATVSVNLVTKWFITTFWLSIVSYGSWPNHADKIRYIFATAVHFPLAFAEIVSIEPFNGMGRNMPQEFLGLRLISSFIILVLLESVLYIAAQHVFGAVISNRAVIWMVLLTNLGVLGIFAVILLFFLIAEGS